MIISNFANVYDKTPQLQELSWEEFTRKLSQHIETDKKTDAPAISPAEWAPGEERKKSKVVRVHLAAIDLDKVSRESLKTLKAKLEPYSYVVHTTWSHSDADKEKGLFCLRMYLPLSRPVEAAEWPRFWKGLEGFFGGLLDPSCKDPGRLYFLPSAKAGSSQCHFSKYQTKEALPVESFLARPKIETATRKQNFSIDKVALLARELSTSSSAYQREIAQRLDLLVQGKTWAKVGERDTTLFKLCALLAEKWPSIDAHEIAACFAPSLEAMEAEEPGAPTIDDVVAKLSRKQAEAKEKSELELSADDRTRIFNAFGRKRDTPYTDDELDAFARSAGLSRERFHPLWIIQRGAYYYFFKNGSYGPAFSSHEMVNAALRDLAPAISASVSCWRTAPNGTKVQKNDKELVRDYGTIASSVVVDMTAQKSFYQWDTNTLVEAPCPLRPLKAEFSELVDGYFRKLGGEYQEKLLDWIASVTLIEKPCAALFLHGVQGGGKGLLAMGLSRLWRIYGPTLLKDVFGNFNDSLANCPLILSDEKLPGHFKLEGNTEDLRSFIQERSRPLRRKYLPHADLIGTSRLIIAANNKDVFQTGENLTIDDIKAIRERILDIPVTIESQKYLSSLSASDLSAFIEGDGIAKHALWLKENRVVVPDGRFLVSGCDTAFHRSFPTATGIASDILHWLTCYLQNPAKIDAIGSLLMRIEDGELLVTAKCIIENWEVYQTNTDTRRATSSRICRALASLSTGKKKQFKNGRGIKTNYWPIRTEYLLSWNADSGFATDEELMSALGGGVAQ